jgi:1-acyl-sn-glycerol-3-phosphate acyltransferase
MIRWQDGIAAGGRRGHLKRQEEWVARRELGFWRRLIVVAVKPVLIVLTRRDWSGMQHVPATGGVILVASHISHADPLVYAHFVYDAGRWPQFLAKQSLFDVPALGRLLRRARQIPVHRGSVDAVKALDAAISAIKAGDGVIIYPEGTTTKEPDLWPMRGKTGAARLALLTGAPLVPIVTWGPERIFDPRTGKLRLRPRMPVTVVAGPPVDLSRWAGAGPTRAVLEEITETIMLRLREMIAEVRGDDAPPIFQQGKAQ